VVELRSKSSLSGRLNTTTNSCVGDLTVDTDSIALLLAVPDEASATGVEGDLVLGVEVDALEDVNLSSVRPVWTIGPDGGPQSTCIIGDVIHVDDEKTSGEGLFGFDSDRLSSIVLLVGAVHTDEGSAVAVDSGQTSGSGISSVQVVHCSMGRVGPSEEVEAIKEVGSVKIQTLVVLAAVGCLCWLGRRRGWGWRSRTSI